MADIGSVIVFKTLAGCEVVLKRRYLVAIEISHSVDTLSWVYAEGMNWSVPKDVAMRLSVQLESGNYGD